MMAERSIVVDHSTLHCWVIRLVPLLDKAFVDINILWSDNGE
ncbi:IS1327 transposase, partial [Yersinia aldovae ATCC 35236]